MIRKNRLNKIYLIIFFLLSVGLITFFILRALEKNIDLYLTPSDVKAADFNQPDDFKLGGMVKVGSLEKLEGLEISFIVTDFESEMTVIYEGVLPNLFKENSGVVATGSLNSEQNQFIATEILAKHDENYMPVKIEVQN
ncbi:MAG: cytochrome c maturation protein CcmE [Pseudomonadota bacterium]|jgi:cytochrome c-type biogenesis protein CcmE|nr:cytochrome c maturation protein CcmE [Pseudomonadota bacterium]|tara:strand:- start:568 stop:984 length:417 start_codon:yes stop_codon:yes gene_type:complete